MSDAVHMRHALGLARRALGRVAPNPAVGCVIVSRDGRVAGTGWTQPGGRPHAETLALTHAATAARGGTAYVTLEPCAHLGQTSPCADALVDAGITRVVAAVEDPDPRVKGKGFAILQRAGVDLTVGVLKKEAADLNSGFLLRICSGRPSVTLKIAQSKSGKTIPAPGASRLITAEEARRFAHLLRAQHDAILIGVGTAISDDPELTCRLPGLEDRSPVRAVLDTHLRLPLASKLARMARKIPTLVFTAIDRADSLRAQGVEVIRVMRDPSGRPALPAVLGVLAGRGCTRLLVEGGAITWSAFLRAGLADRLEIFTAPTDLCGDAAGEVQSLAELTELGRLTQVDRRAFGLDVLETYAVTA